MSSFEELLLKLRELSATKSQYEDYNKQMTVAVQTAQAEMTKLQKEYEEKTQFIQNHPVNINAEQDYTTWSQKISQVDENGRIALRQIESRIQDDNSQESSKSFLQTENVQNFKEIARGVRQLQARIKAFEISKKQLQNEKEMKENLKEDIQRELQDIRSQAKEFEDALTQYSQKLYIERNEFLNKLESNKSTHAEKLVAAKEKKVQTEEEYTTIKMSIDKLDDQLPSLAGALEAVKPKIQQEQVPLFLKLHESSTSLLERAEKFKILLKTKLYLTEAFHQNKSLTEQLNQIIKSYGQTYEKVRETKLGITKKLTNIYSLDQMIKENEINKNSYKDEEEKLALKLKKCMDKLDVKNAELTDVTGQIADERRKQNQNMILDFQVYSRQILDFEKQNTLQNDQIQREHQATQQFSQYSQLLRESVDLITANPSNQPLIKDSIQKFKDTMYYIGLLLKGMVEASNNSLTSFEAQMESVKLQVDQQIKSLKWTVNRSEILSTTMKVKAVETDNPAHGGPTLKDFNSSKIKYSDEGGKVYVDTIEIEDLCMLLFHPDVSDAFLAQTIFAWHNSYFSDLSNMEPCLVEQLGGLYNHLINYQNNASQFSLSERPSSVSVASVVIKVFQIWLDLFPTDFGVFEDKAPHPTWEKLKEAAIKVITMAEEIARSEDSPENQQKAEEVVALRKKLNEKPTFKTLTEPAWTLSVPNNPKVSFIINTAISAETIANHFMFFELQLYNSIQRFEYLRCAWSKPKRDELSPNLTKLTKHFNETAVYIALTIVQPLPNIKKASELKAQRVAILQKWIEVMEASKNINNYMLVFEIDGALTNPAIIRLKTIWAALPQEVQARYKKLSSITAPFRKFATYKEELKKNPIDQTLPYLGPWLTEMTFVEDGNPGKKPLNDGKEGINFTKMRSYYLPALFLMNKWGTECKFQLNRELEDQITHLAGEISSIDNSTLFTYSNDCVKNN